MKIKKPYVAAKATRIVVNTDDVIRTSSFDGPGVPLLFEEETEEE